MVIATNRPTMVNLSCYSCSSLEDPYCLNVSNTTQEYLSRECQSKEKSCSVTRIEYEKSDHTGTIFWALERKCSSSCIQGCIILGKTWNNLLISWNRSLICFLNLFFYIFFLPLDSCFVYQVNELDFIIVVHVVQMIFVIQTRWASNWWKRFHWLLL